LIFLDRFNILISKIILKNIILIYFQTKSTLKNNNNHTFKYPKNIVDKIDKTISVEFETWVNSVTN